MVETLPLTPAIGAELTGLDLSSVGPAEARALKQALATHQVLFCRDQSLDLSAQKRLTSLLGPVLRLPYVEPMADEPDVIRVLKEADEGGGVFGGDWHTDFSFLDAPPAGSILNAREVPPVGGDTIWASQATAYETLPEPIKALLAGRAAIHVGKPYGAKWAPPVDERSGASIRMSRGDPEADRERRHPAVLKNPETGREALFLNPTYTLRLDGLTEAQSAPILAQVQAHATRPEFTCRWRWRAGDVAIWDNLFTQHFAVNDYYGHRREMWRTTFGGPKPRDLAA